MSSHAKTITLGELKERCLNDIMSLPDDTEIIFGSGDLTFYRTKWRGDSLLQIEFNEVYTVDQQD